MKNIQISSPETDRKVARPASIIFMVCAWLFMAVFLAWVLYCAHSYDSPWDVWTYVFVGIPVLALFIIPIQLVRYIREKRTSQ